MIARRKNFGALAKKPSKIAGLRTSRFCTASTLVLIPKFFNARFKEIYFWYNYLITVYKKPLAFR